MRHHPLREERIEWLDRAFRQVPADMHRARKEPRIEQVQNRVLDPSDILVHIHPVGHIGHIRRRLRPRTGEPRVIPGRIDEGIHCVGLALRRLPAGRARHIAPGRMPVQGIARHVETHIVRQLNRQVLLFLRHHAARRAMHHRDRTAPIALPRQSPVPQAIIGDTLAPAVLLGHRDGRVDGLLASRKIQTGKVVDPPHPLRLRRNKRGIVKTEVPGAVHFGDIAIYELRIQNVLRRKLAILRHEGLDHRQLVLPAEI